MLLRVAFGVGLLALGYFVGREMGRNESLRRELERDTSADGPGPEDEPCSPGGDGDAAADPGQSPGDLQR